MILWKKKKYVHAFVENKCLVVFFLSWSESKKVRLGCFFCCVFSHLHPLNCIFLSYPDFSSCACLTFMEQRRKKRMKKAARKKVMTMKRRRSHRWNWPWCPTMEASTESEYVLFPFSKQALMSVVCGFLSACSRVEFQATQRGEQSLAAVWSEKGQVEIFDLQPQLEAVRSSAAMAAFASKQKEATSLFSFSGHMTEGFAIDWSPTVPGRWAPWPEMGRGSTALGFQAIPARWL